MSGSPSEVVANLITGASSNCQESREHIWWWGVKMDHSSGLDDVSLERYSGQTRSDKQSHDKDSFTPAAFKSEMVGNWPEKVSGGSLTKALLFACLGYCLNFSCHYRLDSIIQLKSWLVSLNVPALLIADNFLLDAHSDQIHVWSRTHATKLFLLRIRAEAASQGDQSVASVRWPLPLPRDNPIKLQLSKFICQENTLHLTSNHYRYPEKNSICCQLDDVQSNIQWPPRVNKWPTLPLTTENGKNLTIKLEREVLVGS